jgi:hypothetical protein
MRTLFGKTSAADWDAYTSRAMSKREHRRVLRVIRNDTALLSFLDSYNYDDLNVTFTFTRRKMQANTNTRYGSLTCFEIENKLRLNPFARNDRASRAILRSLGVSVENIAVYGTKKMLRSYQLGVSPDRLDVADQHGIDHDLLAALGDEG